jgi:hypothetical protein
MALILVITAVDLALGGSTMLQRPLLLELAVGIHHIFDTVSQKRGPSSVSPLLSKADVGRKTYVSPHLTNRGPFDLAHPL